MRHQMIHVREHIEVYDQYGEFLFSADNEQEALEDLALMLQEPVYSTTAAVVA